MLREMPSSNFRRKSQILRGLPAITLMRTKLRLSSQKQSLKDSQPEFLKSWKKFQRRKDTDMFQ